MKQDQIDAWAVEYGFCAKTGRWFKPFGAKPRRVVALVDRIRRDWVLRQAQEALL